MRILLILPVVAATVAAQPAMPPAATVKIDYEKHVKPILAQKCNSCHGEDVQQAGLRLDKRQNAMRGGDYGPVILSGKSGESRLIKRVVSGDGGMQMPPSGPLAPEEIGILRAWIDQGVDFRIAIKDDAPPKPVDPRVAGLIAAIRRGESPAIAKGMAGAADAAGSTLLHHAAAFGSVASMQALLAAGAPVNAANRRRATPLHWAIHDAAKARLLVEAGADVKAKQADGRSVLYQAAFAGNGNAVLRMLLEKGADANAATANGQTPLMAAAGRGDVEAMRLLLGRGATVDAKSGTGSTALMAAATSREPAAVALLVEAGADVNAATKKNETALANAATAGDEASVRLLLAKGAKVNLADDRGYSPLMYAAAAEPIAAGVVKMLLAKGADPACTGEGETAATLAAKRGQTEVARLLGAPAMKAPAVANRPRGAAEAVTQALGLLEKQSYNFIRIAGCNSCHSQDLPSAANAVARRRGIAAPKEIPQLPVSMTGITPERLMDLGAAGAGSIAWEMFDRSMNGLPADDYTDATVYFLKAMQTAEGHWRSPEGRRPPMNAGDVQTTAMVVAAIKAYSRVDETAVMRRVAAWLTKVRPATNQDLAFRLLGLAWANGPAGEIEKAARELATAQRSDGGWGQLPEMRTDAFATGQALYALHTAGKTGVNDPVYRKGTSYLLRTQEADGSWHVNTRSIWIQPYFESGFPHGHDQWISTAGTAWATMALSLTVEPAKLSRR
jgi:ankyrin repeat protein